ncbi:cobyric acid synthase [Lentilactobacillus raoultii]|uniref:Cobyric acid synthase n=1 Tax=Lentilactobacillus raoultii TaxID=1987503 RepID=A0ABW3PKZ6_9LACO|nr:cobyric acid synthase [Lentilactobacillus raoultii]
MGTKSIMFQGTTSDAGKSWTAAALCRLLKNRGLRVAPFKSQNMALNSFITKNGDEMGRAQVFQAEAAGKQPDVRMNPVLLKPSTDKDAQVIFMGKVLSDMSAVAYHQYKFEIKDKVRTVYQSLAKENDVMVLEGAGSPAEINLNDRDIVNMGMARMADCPVILVADIDKGGVYAAIYGTIKLMPKEDQRRIKGIIINKFRGDRSLLTSGNQMIEALTGVPVIGVIPMTTVDLDEEDSVVLSQKSQVKKGTCPIDIAVISLPKISNFTDFHALEIQPDVSVRYILNPEEIGLPDILIIPGSKNTNEDMAYLRRYHFVQPIKAVYSKGSMVVGICGGYQMLGTKLVDEDHVESDINDQEGLGLLNIETSFTKEKKTTQVTAKHGVYYLNGYEIHMGETSLGKGVTPFSVIVKSNGKSTRRSDGATNADGRIWGTYLHGIFDNERWTRHLLNQLRVQKGLPALHHVQASMSAYREAQYEKLAKVFEENVDMKKIDEILSSSDVKK